MFCRSDPSVLKPSGDRQDVRNNVLLHVGVKEILYQPEDIEVTSVTLKR